MSEAADDAAENARGTKLAELLHVLPRRRAVWAVGAAVVVAATSAVAIAATSSNSPAAPPAAASQSPLAAKQADALDAIVGPSAEVRQPVAALVKQGKLPKATYAGDTGTVGVPKNAKAPKQAKAGSVPQFNAGPLNGSYSLVQMASLAMQAGCSASEAAIAAAIGAAESSGNPGAQGDITLMDGTWDWSEGLWQIRGLRAERDTGGLRDSVANASPTKNAQAMREISSGCTNWTPWSTYNSGAYLAYLGLSRSAASAADKYHEQTGSYVPVTSSGGPATVPVANSAGATGRRSASSAPKKSGKASSVHAPKPSTAPGTPTSAAPSTPTKPHPKPSSSSKATASTTPKPSLSLPIKLPTSLPTTLPIKLPTSLPTTLPISLPVTLPSLPIGLP